MAPSSSNKRKLDLDFSRDPIIFISPGLPRDVRITVFRQEFHLNSVLLKLHSAYFRTFLGSADKSGKPASAKFRYDYVSVIGGDGDWILETVEKAPATAGESLVPHANLVTEDFQILLCAMDNRPYTVHDAGQLIRITMLADFYCALPILSATLVAGLMGSPMFKPSRFYPSPFAHAAPELMHTAKKLRNSVLFRECFIHVVGRWASRGLRASFPDAPSRLTGRERQLIEEDDDVFRLVIDACLDIQTSILDLNNHLLVASVKRDLPLDDFDSGLANNRFGKFPTRNLHFWRDVKKAVDRRIAEDENASPALRVLDADLRFIMTNNLSLDKRMKGSGVTTSSVLK